MPPRLGAGGSGGGGVRVPIDGDVTGLQRGLAQAETAIGRFGGRMDAFGQRMDRTGQALTRSLTIPIAGAGVAAGKLAIDFESAMSRIVGLVGVSRKQVDEWGRDILALAPKVGKGPRELAEAMFFITSAGLRGQAALDALEVSARASAAGLGETMVVADAVTSAVNSYGAANLSAAEATDVLTATVREGKASADTIAPVIGRLTPLAAELGVSFNDVGAALAQMTRQGAPAAEASTMILGVMRGLLRPSAEARKGMQEVGLSAEELRRSVRERGLLATLQTMKEAVGGNTAELAKLLPDMEGLRGALAIVGKGAKDAEGIFGRMADTTGTADRAFEAASETAGLKLQKALATLQARGVELGNRLIPVASDIAEGFVEVIDAFDRLPGSAKRAAGAGAIILAGLGPAMSAVGLLSRGISGIGRGLGSLAGRGVPGAAGGGIAAGLGRGAPVPVFVTNPGFGGGLGGPGGVAGRGGAVGGTGRVVVPGIGALATGGIGAPLLAGGALIGAGVFASRSDAVAGAIPGLMTREQSRRAVREAQDRMVQAWREGGPEMWRRIGEASTGSAILGEAYGRNTAEAAQEAIDVFRGTFDRGRGRIKEGTRRVIETSLDELRRLKPEARNLAADSLITMAGELERKGRVPRGTVQRLVRQIERSFGELPPAVKRSADLTIAGLRGVPAILRDIGRAATDAVRDVRAGLANIREIAEREAARIRAIDRSRGSAAARAFAMGGFVPGRFDGRDDVRIRVSRGEVILNPAQQRIVGIDRIVGALRATGGIVGGDGALFAAGGYVSPLPGGSWNGSPADHKARALGNWQSDNAWDIFAPAGTPVYAVRAGTIPRITPPGSTPQFAGHGVYLQTADNGTWWYRHIDAAVSAGQSVSAGQVLGHLVGHTAGGPHLHLATDAGDPARARGGVSPSGAGRLGFGAAGNQTGAGEPSLAQLRRFKRGAIGAARRLIGRGAVGDRSVSDVLSETISGAQRGSSLREKRRRAFAEEAARSAGISNPDKIRALGEIEVQRLRRQEVGRDARLVKAAAAKVRKQIARWRAHARKLYKALAKTDPRNRGRIQSLLDGIRNAKDREREAVQELRALIAQAADLQAEASELDWDIGQLVEEVAQMESTEPGEVPGEAGPSADQQAQLDQANRRAEIAERQALAGEAFIRAIGSSSDIDPSSGSVTIIVNAPGGLVYEQEVGRWVVEALRGQGAPGASVSRSPA